MTDYASALSRTLTPYTPGEQSAAGIKLNTNENAYGPSPKVFESVCAAVSELRLYPEPESDSLRYAVCRYLGGDLTVDNIFVGNGSDEVLAMAFMAFFAGSSLAAPEVTYSFYPVYARLYQAGYEAVPMKPGFCVDVDALLTTRRAAILANPNAPTSIALPFSEIERMARALLEQKKLLLVDEAYAAFGGESAVGLILKYENLLIVNTLSKSHALAGLRIGFAVGQPPLIKALTTVKNCVNSYPLDRLAQAGGIAALGDTEYFTDCRDKIIGTRQWFSKTLEDIGYNVLPSSANFVYVSHPLRDGASLYGALRERGILVRHFGAPMTRDWLRITIGIQSDMELVAKAMKELTA